MQAVSEDTLEAAFEHATQEALVRTGRRSILYCVTSSSVCVNGLLVDPDNDASPAVLELLTMYAHADTALLCRQSVRIHWRQRLSMPHKKRAQPALSQTAQPQAVLAMAE